MSHLGLLGHNELCWPQHWSGIREMGWRIDRRCGSHPKATQLSLWQPPSSPSRALKNSTMWTQAADSSSSIGPECGKVGWQKWREWDKCIPLGEFCMKGSAWPRKRHLCAMWEKDSAQGPWWLSLLPSPQSHTTQFVWARAQNEWLLTRFYMLAL